jgi:hypothetical protein
MRLRAELPGSAVPVDKHRVPAVCEPALGGRRGAPTLVRELAAAAARLARAADAAVVVRSPVLDVHGPRAAVLGVPRSAPAGAAPAGRTLHIPPCGCRRALAIASRWVRPQYVEKEPSGSCQTDFVHPANAQRVPGPRLVSGHIAPVISGGACPLFVWRARVRARGETERGVHAVWRTRRSCLMRHRLPTTRTRRCTLLCLLRKRHASRTGALKSYRCRCRPRMGSILRWFFSSNRMYVDEAAYDPPYRGRPRSGRRNTFDGEHRNIPCV